MSDTKFYKLLEFETDSTDIQSVGCKIVPILVSTKIRLKMTQLTFKMSCPTLYELKKTQLTF